MSPQLGSGTVSRSFSSCGLCVADFNCIAYAYSYLSMSVFDQNLGTSSPLRCAVPLKRRRRRQFQLFISVEHDDLERSPDETVSLEDVAVIPGRRDTDALADYFRLFVDYDPARDGCLLRNGRT